MSGGGGNKVPTAQEQAQAQIAIMREQARLDADKAAAEKARADAERAQTIARAANRQQAGYDNALQYGNTQIGARGFDQGLVDQYGILDLYRSALDQRRGTFAEDDVNPLYGEATAFSDALQSGTERYRNDLTKQFRTGAGTGESHFLDTMDDHILDAILGTERSDVEAQIKSAFDRGQLNQAGYDKAMSKLNTSALGARSELEDIGRGILSGYRSQYDTRADQGLSGIGQANFNNAFDLGGALSGLQSLRESLSGRLEGDLYRATSGQSFLNPSSIISYGGNMQGFFNPTQRAGVGGAAGTNPLLAAFTEQNKPNSGNQLTSAGNNGVF